ncbi:hypothetical protein MTO96_051042 [Rhipicephalus appendiculatus]
MTEDMALNDSAVRTSKSPGTESTPSKTPKSPERSSDYTWTTVGYTHTSSYLSGIFNSRRDPCDNFYKFTCADWHAISSDLQQYDTADDAVTGLVEEMAKTVLDGGRPAEFKPLFNLWNACKQTGVVTDNELKSALASLGLNVSKAATVTTSDVLRAAGTLLYKLDNAPILSVELVSNPWNATPKLIALGEPDILVSRVDVQVEARRKKLADMACKFFTAWAYSGERNDTLCDAVADIAFALAKLSRLDHHVTEQMNLYGVASHAYIRMFMPFLSIMNGTKDYVGENATYVVKNILQVGILRDLLKSKPREVLAYMAFHTTVYLSPLPARQGGSLGLRHVHADEDATAATSAQVAALPETRRQASARSPRGCYRGGRCQHALLHRHHGTYHRTPLASATAVSD